MGVVELERRIPNTHIAFDLEISKFKDYGNGEQSGLEQPAEGVVFEIVSNSSKQVVGTLTTNIYGFASTKDQPRPGLARAHDRTASMEPSPTIVRAIPFARSRKLFPQASSGQKIGPSRPSKSPTEPIFST